MTARRAALALDRWFERWLVISPISGSLGKRALHLR
jgi:hypothetical protein